MSFEHNGRGRLINGWLRLTSRVRGTTAGSRSVTSIHQFVRFAESVPISTSPILFTPLFAVTMLP